jgi:adenylyltransferase/sulfurtransferase
MHSNPKNERYARQTQLEGFGVSAQNKLASASVLVVGAGALGCPVLTYLVAAGVGKIGIVDADKVELSNLHRQVLYNVEDIGKHKAKCAEARLSSMNPEIEMRSFTKFIHAGNAFELANEYDIIIDGTDNFPTRYLINDVCVLTGKVNIHGSIQQFSGQVSVFNALLDNGERGPNYRDIYPLPPNPNHVVSCAEGGVIGALPGIIGSMMAMECIKAITGVGEVLSGKLLQYHSLTGRSHLLTFTQDDENPLTGSNPTQTQLIDYDQFCGLKTKNKMKSINVFELKEMMEKQEDFQLIDVREQFEYDEANMNGHLIPLSEIPNRFSEIDKTKKVVIHCKMGGRSANAIGFLEQNHGFENLYNLEGGIIAWLTTE